jgi:F0F1-type ATP synthase assembly protein I
VPALAYQLRAGMVRGKGPRELLGAQYAGEGFKFAVSMVMFYLVFTRLRPLEAPVFFMTFIAALSCYFAASLIDPDG